MKKDLDIAAAWHEVLTIWIFIAIGRLHPTLTVQFPVAIARERSSAPGSRTRNRQS
jgi:hypothetical protein